MPYSLGPVKAHVKAAAESIGAMFSVSTIYGVAARSGESDHPFGLALDFMVYGDSAKGESIAQYVQQNSAPLSVKYVIWNQHIWSPQRASEGWRLMEDRGSATANHKDHVHVSFNSTAGTGTAASAAYIPGIPDIPGVPDAGDVIGGAVGLGQGAADAIGKVGQFFAWISDGHNWVRIGYFVGGVILIIFGLIRLGMVNKSTVQTAKNVAGKVAQQRGN